MGAKRGHHRFNRARRDTDSLASQRILIALQTVSLGAVAAQISISGIDRIATQRQWLSVLTFVAVAALCHHRSRCDDVEGPIWGTFAIALVMWTAGDVVDLAWSTRSGFGMLAELGDLLRLSFFPFAAAAVLQLGRSRSGGHRLATWLDGTAVGTAVAAIVTLMLAGPSRVLVEDPDRLHRLVTLLYPAGGLVLLFVAVAGLAANGWRPDRAYSLVAGGVGLLTLANISFVSRMASEGTRIGGLADAGFAGGAVLISIASIRDNPDSSEVEAEVATRHRPAIMATLDAVRPFVFPVAAVAVAIVLLMLGSLQQIPVVASLLAIATCLTAAARTGLSYQELRGLVETRRQALTDELTGLPNRRSFTQWIDEVMPSATSESQVALLLLDLDGFKEVNDSFGHPTGDALLCAVSERFANTLRGRARLARLGGDEFGIVLTEISEVGEAMAVAERIRNTLREPFALNEARIHVDASIGVAVHGEHDADPEDLLRHADVAMYHAKRQRLGVVAYDPRFDQSRWRMQVMNDLRSGLTERIELHYQPKVDLITGHVVGVEALARWRHPGGALIGPDDFVPIAEQSGLIHELTNTVLEKALAQAAEWHSKGIQLAVAVNVSSRDLSDTEFPRRLSRMLRRHGVAPSMITLEITERNLTEDQDNGREALRAVRALGVRVAVDDFGIGYSSLSQLRHLEVDELKLDRSFVTAIHTDDRTQSIVALAVLLAVDLKTSLVVEGVESTAERRKLIELGCRYAQGYLMKRPVTAEELVLWLGRPGAPVGIRRQRTAPARASA